LAACGQSATPAAPAGKPSSTSAGSIEGTLYEAAKKEGTVVWWDSFDKKFVDSLIAGFKKRYPGIEVESFLATIDDQKVRALSEVRAGKVSFDVIAAIENYTAFKQAGLINSIADVLEAAGVSRNIQFEGTYNPEWTVFGVGYNTNLVKAEDLPKT